MVFRPIKIIPFTGTFHGWKDQFGEGIKYLGPERIVLQIGNAPTVPSVV